MNRSLPGQPTSFQNLQAFIHESIEGSENKFRLVNLRAGFWGDPIRCDLQIYQLGDNPKYETVSYAWGSEADKSSIVVNGAVLIVPKSLETALRHLRKPQSPTSLWADSICIDQKNGHEKMIQVALMGEIFRRCSKVNIWLGTPKSLQPNFIKRQCNKRWATNCVMRTPAKSSASPGRKVEAGSEEIEEPVVTVSDMRDGDPAYNDPFALIRHFAQDRHFADLPCFKKSSNKTGDLIYSKSQSFLRMWYDFQHAATSPWWSRFWCVQEALLPPVAVVILGMHEFPWDTLRMASLNHRRHILTCCKEAWKVFPKKYAVYEDHLIADAQSSVNTRRGLDIMLKSYRHRDCKQKVDKVFGILGLVDPMNSYGLKPDYTLSAAEVYLSATEAIMTTCDGSLQFLTGSGFNSGEVGMPSWVRNLAYCPDITMLHHELFRDQAYALYTTSKKAAARLRIEQGSKLQVEGFRIDVVAKVGQIAASRKLGHIIQVLRQWHRVASLKPYRCLKDLEDPKQKAFWRTCLADVVPASQDSWRRLTASDIHNYQEWLLSHRKNPLAALFGRRYQPSFEVTFVKALISAILGRAIFVTSQGHVGLCYPGVRPKDEVWALHGGAVPFILRPRAEYIHRQPQLPLEFVFIGDCYLDGFMDDDEETKDRFCSEKVSLV